MEEERRGARQAIGLLLICLLAGHEVHAMNMTISSASAGLGGAHGSRFASAGGSFSSDIRDGATASVSAAGDARGTAVTALDWHELFAEPSAAVSALALHSGGAADPRKLDVFISPNPPYAGWMWPSQTILTVSGPKLEGGVEASTVSYSDTPTQKTLTLVASFRYNAIKITATGTTLEAPHGRGTSKLKLVQASADRFKCATNSYNAAVGLAAETPTVIPAAMGLGIGPRGGPVIVDIDGSNKLRREGIVIIFMHGGPYKLCYSPDGTFGPIGGTDYVDNTLLTEIQVLGIKSACKAGYGDGCMSKEKWNCWFGYGGEDVENSNSEPLSGCVFSFMEDGGPPGWDIFPGMKSKMTWSNASTWEDSNLGKPICGEVAQGNSGKPGTFYVGPTSEGFYRTVDNNGAVAAMPPVAGQTHAFMVVACYCPNYDAMTGEYCASDGANCCKQELDFIQMFGTIYYWTTRVCDGDDFEGGGACQEGADPYRRVIPHQRFTLRLECPPFGACNATTTNRIKFLDATRDNDRPNWMPSQGCRMQTAESTEVQWPQGVQDSLNVDGGTGLRYKYWHGIRVKLTLGQEIDVCYANSNHADPDSWFRVGTVTMSSQIAIANRPSQTTATGGPQDHLKYVNYRGSITFYSGIRNVASILDPWDGNKFSGQSVIKLLSYDREKDAMGYTMETRTGLDKTMPFNFQRQMDVTCQTAYSPDLVDGPSSAFRAYQDYVGQAVVSPPWSEEKTSVDGYLSFSGTSQANVMGVKRAGVIAICYCGLVKDGECSPLDKWIYVGRTTIRGPSGKQQWIFPTNIIVDMQVTGWGLSSKDKLRIINGSDYCGLESVSAPSPPGDPHDPLGVRVFKVGCPTSLVGCRTAGAKEDISMTAVSSTSSVGHITSVAVDQTKTILTFSKPVAEIPLKEDDMITIDRTKVKVDDTAYVDMKSDQRLNLYKFSGEWEFYNDRSQTRQYYVAHKLKRVPIGSDDPPTAYEPLKMSIPIGWQTNAPAFTFQTPMRGDWIQRNLITSARELKGKKATPELEPDMKVCWGVKSQFGSGVMYYAEAGGMRFEEPALMPADKVIVSYTTRVRAMAQPVVISFETGDNKLYASSTGQTQLLLRFKDAGNDGMLVPAKAGVVPPGLLGLTSDLSIGDDEQVVPNMLRQSICGKLFIELWSSHEYGFPLPLGCYYGPKQIDNPEVPPVPDADPDPNYYREIYLIFGEGNGLRPNTRYQMVMNAQARNAVTGVELIDMYAMCAEVAGCPRPYMVFEKGVVKADSVTLDAASNNYDPNWADGTKYVGKPVYGVEVQRGEAPGGGEEALELSSLNILQLRLAGGLRTDNFINPGDFIRFFLFPLTMWDITSAAGSADCIPFYGPNSPKCQSPIPWEPAKVSAKGGYNVIKLRLPTGPSPTAAMTPMSLSVGHTIRITGLRLPRGGFFPMRLGAELTRGDTDASPRYTNSFNFIMKQAAYNETNGRLVLSDRTGYGPKPFAGDRENILYIRLQFGATLWNNGQSDAAQFDVKLPLGYKCTVPVGTGHPEPTLPVFARPKEDEVPTHMRAVLSDASDDGAWQGSVLGPNCVYVIRDGNAIFYKQVVYVRLTVNNPLQAMAKLSNANIWTIKLSAKGAHKPPESTTYNAWDMPREDTNPPQPDQRFITLGQERDFNAVAGAELWGSNVAVLNHLSRELIQPSDFRRSCCGFNYDPRVNFLRVFFRSGSYVGRNGFVMLDAPPRFDFGADCLPQDLPETYYGFIGNDRVPPRLLRLRNLGACKGIAYNSPADKENRAKFFVGGVITSMEYYGFEIKVTHPEEYDESQHFSWYLWTMDSNGYGIEGSRSTIRFHKLLLFDPVGDMVTTTTQLPPYYSASFGMYRDHSGHVTDNVAVEYPHILATHRRRIIQLVDRRPSSLNNDVNRQIIFYFVKFEVVTDTSLRITAPHGFRWDAGAVDGTTFEQTTNGTAEPFPLPDAIEGDFYEQMVWNSPTFRGGFDYAFRAQILVPDHSPVISSNAFFIEFGWRSNNIKERLMGMVIEAPMVSALTNAKISYISNLEYNTNNYMEFAVQTWTPLKLGQGIIITGDQNTNGLKFKDKPPIDIGTDKLPADAFIKAKAAVSGLPMIEIKAYSTIPPGHYQIQVEVENNLGKTLNPGIWNFGSYSNTQIGILSDPIDKSLNAIGFKINSPINDARLITIDNRIKEATRRDDRPGRENSLIFRISLNSKVVRTRDLRVRGPRGFQFEEDCMDGVITSQDSVFGPNSADEFDPALQIWPESAAPTACTGDGQEAAISIPPGLFAQQYYAFRISVRNPLTTPIVNKWTIDFNDESSEPFEGFKIWTNAVMVITASTTGKSPTLANVQRTVNSVRIYFQPSKTVTFRGSTNTASGASGGLIIVAAPVGFEFLQDDDSKCKVLLYEQGTGTAERFATFADSDLDCTVDNKNKIIVEIIGDMPVQGDKLYNLIVSVYNPKTTQSPQEWRMNSFSGRPADPTTELDVSSKLGFEINNVLSDFTVKNVYDTRKGNSKVAEVLFTLQFPDPIWDGDLLDMFAPRGFELPFNPDNNNCQQFEWVNTDIPLPTSFASGAPFCMCTGLNEAKSCRLYFPVQENRQPALGQNKALIFTISTLNPARTPSVMDNYWKVTHFRDNAIKSTHVYASWDIDPQLEDVDVRLPSAPYAEGKDSDIEFRFTPVSNAGTMKIKAVRPPGFSFNMATVSVPFDIDPLTDSDTIIINRVALEAGRPAIFRINNVRLGRGGGQTEFNIITYKGELRLDGSGEKCDEKLQFVGGFRLPGRITITNYELKSKWQEQEQDYPVHSLFQPRIDEDATAEFTIRLTQNVYANDAIIISCTGEGKYTLFSTPFVVIGTGRVTSSPSLNAAGEIEAVLKPGMSASVVAMQAEMLYRVFLKVIPRAGTNSWRFDTTDYLEFPGGKTYPTNTNDGATIDFGPVKWLTINVRSDRSPPGARIIVYLNVKRNNAVIRELVVFAPPGFDFPASGCGEMCQPGQAEAGRKAATIASPTGEPLTNAQLETLSIRVVTPELTPYGEFGTTWFVQGRGQGAGRTTGWGYQAGFNVVQMAPSATFYPGVANLRNALITFNFRLDVDAGTVISVVPPTGFMLTCSTDGALRQISLPGKKPECVDDPLELILANTLTAGEYAFGISVTMPPETPKPNNWNLIIKNQDAQVVDAAYGLTGQPIVNIRVKDPSFDWTTSQPGVSTVITFGLTFEEPTDRLKAILLNFPDQFVHAVQRPTDVQNLNKRFRVAAGQEWADITLTDRLRIFLDDSRETTTIAADTYAWNFPAMVPCCTEADMPKNNVWLLSLCEDRNCKEPDDPSVLVTLPMVGFSLQEISPQSLKLAAFARRRAPLGLGGLVLPLLLAVLGSLPLLGGALFAPP